MKSWKLWLIASNEDEGGVSSHIVDFDTQEKAEDAYDAVAAADDAEGYTHVEAVRLYEAPLPPGWDK